MKKFLQYVLASTFGFILAQMIIVFMFIAVMGIFAGQSSKFEMKESKSDDKPRILEIQVRGSFPEQRDSIPDAFRPFVDQAPSYSLNHTIKAIRKAIDDEEIEGIYLSLGSLSAGWASVQSLRRELEGFKKTGKFIYAYGENLSEKSYYIATISDKIYQYSEGGFELDGLSTTLMFFKGLLQKLDIEPTIFKAGVYKSAIEPLIRNNMSPESRMQSQKLVGDIWNEYIQIISAARKVSPQQLKNWADNLSITSAKHAFSNKLVDQLKTETQVFGLIKKQLKIEEDKKLPKISVGRYFKAEKKFSRFYGAPKRTKGENQIAIIVVEGEIVTGKSRDDLVGSHTVVKQIRKAKEDKDVKGVVIRVNSPGGSALASDVIWAEAIDLDKVKPVIVSMGNIAASGGYYIAAAGRHIFAEATTITGSIGVFGVMFNLKDFYKNKLSVDVDRVVTNASADAGHAARPLTTFEVAVIQKEVETTYQRFLQVVASSRKASTSEIDAIAQGRVWSGQSALDQNLVDELGGLNQAIEKSAELAGIKDYESYIMSTKEDPWEWILSSLSVDWSTWLTAGKEEYKILKTLSRIRKRQGILTYFPYSMDIQ